MIGQTKLINQLTMLSKDKNLSKFIIFTGPTGSGKKLMTKLLKVLTGFELKEIGIKVDDIRDMINEAYINHNPTIYAIYDADTMSENAKNSMLKICEEPFNSAYIVMTLKDINNTLPTIESRATVFNLEPYTQNDILNYYHTLSKGDESIIVNTCETPGQVNQLIHLGALDFDNFVTNVFDGLYVVSCSNALKIGYKLSLNGEEDKYSLDLFFTNFINKCVTKLNTNIPMYSYGIKITCKYMQNLRYSNLNKTTLFDNWLFELRDGWVQYAKSDS